ncbi:SynChlorMet cassette radical SAM/SPASM protein ScmE [Methanocella sp. MCL-LM]|uniref:SynChlorMet cassette radical SAM/SPASM protein ScmE n=1 Tax=Methanocella sp. MCL-LM TaxID=3412035 RepID=UPI003C72EA0E
MIDNSRLMKTPKSVEIEITNYCNLRCLYCSHFSSPGEVNRDLSLDEWLQFFGELKDCAVMDVTLSGGEPFLRKDIREIIDGIVRNRMRYSILTNGTLITDELASFIASTGRCNMIQISVDGSNSEVHDSCRGEGSFQKAIEGILHLTRHSIPVFPRVTIHKDNVKDLEAIAKLLLDDLGLPGFSTNSASHLGMCRNNRSIQLSVEDRMEAMETLVRLTEKYGDRISALAGPLADARIWSMMENARLKGVKEIAGRGALTGCRCYMEKIAVRADGVIIPCPHLGHIALGRINQDSLRDVWQYHPELATLRSRINIPLKDFEFCRGCDYVQYCTGNCPGLAYTLLGKVNHPSPDACFRCFLSEGGKLPVAALSHNNR